MSRAVWSSLLKVDRFQMIMITLKRCSFLRWSLTFQVDVYMEKNIRWRWLSKRYNIFIKYIYIICVYIKSVPSRQTGHMFITTWKWEVEEIHTTYWIGVTWWSDWGVTWHVGWGLLITTLLSLWALNLVKVKIKIFACNIWLKCHVTLWAGSSHPIFPPCWVCGVLMKLEIMVLVMSVLILISILIPSFQCRGLQIDTSRNFMGTIFAVP